MAAAYHTPKNATSVRIRYRRAELGLGGGAASTSPSSSTGDQSHRNIIIGSVITVGGFLILLGVIAIHRRRQREALRGEFGRDMMVSKSTEMDVNAKNRETDI
ncbi:hypothetical protein PM082_009563 [Marasmius tenuissimus]|nr:hypothetical protein PM082_009563 [Marasmius tenuissimus]